MFVDARFRQQQSLPASSLPNIRRPFEESLRESARPVVYALPQDETACRKEEAYDD